jgi:hypothetical protein
MPALSYLYQLLSTFRPLFARHLPWTMFCAVILGFIGSHHVEAITSLCRFWHMDETGYHQLLHFFHASAWCLDAVVAHWSRLVLAQHVAVMVQGRTVLLGDHTYVVKDARRMPGVVTLHQDSETQSKPTYFRGHHWGLVGLLVGSFSQAWCLPLEARLHQGFAHVHADETDEAQRPTLAVRLVHMALQFAVRHDTPSLLVLDAFFAMAPVFQLAASLWSLRLQQPFLAIVTRAKKNYVAYEPAQPQATPSQGRPPQIRQDHQTPRGLRDPQGAVCHCLVCRLWPRRNCLLPGAESAVKAHQSATPLGLCDHQPWPPCAHV